MPPLKVCEIHKFWNDFLTNSYYLISPRWYKGITKFLKIASPNHTLKNHGKWGYLQHPPPLVSAQAPAHRLTPGRHELIITAAPSHTYGKVEIIWFRQLICRLNLISQITASSHLTFPTLLSLQHAHAAHYFVAFFHIDFPPTINRWSLSLNVHPMLSNLTYLYSEIKILLARKAMSRPAHKIMLQNETLALVFTVINGLVLKRVNIW